MLLRVVFPWVTQGRGAWFLYVAGEPIRRRRLALSRERRSLELWVGPRAASLLGPRDKGHGFGVGHLLR